MKQASEKQLKFGRKIAQLLDIDLPKENTAQAYFLFINEHILEYKDKQISIRDYTPEEKWFCPLEDTF